MPSEQVLPIRPAPADPVEAPHNDAADCSPAPTATVEDPRARPEAAGDRKARLAAAIAAAGGPLAVGTTTAAAMCGMGRATWFRAAAAKKTPAPVRVLGKVLYRVEDLRAWMAMGCPSRKEFEARRGADGAGGRPRAGGR